MEVLIVTGFSGAGKSLAMDALEDIGYYCIDNLPPEFIPSFLELAEGNKEKFQKLALVSDIRGGMAFDQLVNALQALKAQTVPYRVFFLEANTEVLERRFKETRRKHPLAFSDETLSTEEAILKEKKILQPLYEIADYTLDTSVLSTAQLKENVVSLFSRSGEHSMQLKFITFGFKHGLPKDADIVFDVRCLPNPFYVAELKEKTGKNEEIVSYVFASKEAKTFLKKTIDLLAYAIPLYVKEGKSQLTVAVGCTGGKHRSVAFAEELAKEFEQYSPQTFHRDIGK